MFQPVCMRQNFISSRRLHDAGIGQCNLQQSAATFAFTSTTIHPGLVQVSMVAMPLYSLLPAVTEYAVEQGWTRVYADLAGVGLVRHVLNFAVYMTLVEFGVYWMHRGLHDLKVGYK